MIKKEKYERTFYKMTYVKINGAWYIDLIQVWKVC